MYSKTPVPIPQREHGICIKKIKGISYVYFDTYKYNKETKKSVTISRCIGKLVIGKPDMIYPNGNYVEYFCEDGKQINDDLSHDSNSIMNPRSETFNENKNVDNYEDFDDENEEREFSYVHQSWVTKIGCYIVIDKILEDLNLKTILKPILGTNFSLFLDLISFMIITEDNAGWHYPCYAMDHALFSDNMKIASDSTISRFFQSVKEDATYEFLDKWNSLQDHTNKIYITYDSTNKNCQSGDVDMADFGHAKDDPSKPIINYAVAYDLNNKKPLLYEYYPGCINDVSELQDTVLMVKQYGYTMLSFIIDRGSMVES